MCAVLMGPSHSRRQSATLCTSAVPKYEIHLFLQLALSQVCLVHDNLQPAARIKIKIKQTEKNLTPFRPCETTRHAIIPEQPHFFFLVQKGTSFGRLLCIRTQHCFFFYGRQLILLPKYHVINVSLPHQLGVRPIERIDTQLCKLRDRIRISVT